MATMGLLDEVDFEYIKKSMNALFHSALQFFGEQAYFFQAALINREVDDEGKYMTIRWSAFKPKLWERVKPEVREFFLGKTRSRPGGNGLLWSVVKSELDTHDDAILTKCRTEPLFTRVEEPVPPHVPNYYLADLAKPKTQSQAVPVFAEELLYRSSVLVPIWITPMRPLSETPRPEDQKGVLVGVVSVDSSYRAAEFEGKSDALRLVCALTDLVGRTIEALDMAFYDYLLGDAGVLSKPFYYKRLETLNPDERERLVLAFLDLNNFKKVNDEHDHDEGDRVIARFGLGLVKACKQATILNRSWVCRLGGDEFVVLADVDSVERFREWLRCELMKDTESPLCTYLREGERVQCLDKGHIVTPSVGIASWEFALSRKPGAQPFDVARKLAALGDEAMYASKRIFKEYKGGERKVPVLYDTSEKEILRLNTQPVLGDLVRVNAAQPQE